MHPALFEYRRPDSLEEALELLEGAEDARPLAGGQSLLPVMKHRLASPTMLVDLARIPELVGIERRDGRLRLGAMTRYADAVGSPEARRASPALVECLRTVGDAQVRNVGTVGGSVAHLDPAADLPTLLMALGAEVVVRGGEGERRVPIASFAVAPFTTALQPGELVVALELPALGPDEGEAYVKHPHPASRYAVVGVAARVGLSDGEVSGAALAVGGVTGVPVRVQAADELAGAPADGAAWERVGREIPGALEAPMGDHYASGEYRVHLAGVLARRCLARAAERAGG